MNRIHITMTAALLIMLLCILVGCSSQTQTPDAAGAGNEAVGGITDAVQAGPTDEQLATIGEAFGLSEEEIAALPAEEIEMMLLELGYADEPDVPEFEGNADPAPSKKTTLSDVGAGGSYVVTVGDSMLWNYFELYYVDGKLQKIVVHFQKSEGEEEEIFVYEGADATGCELFDIDYSGSPESIAHQLNETMGYSSVYIEPAK